MDDKTLNNIKLKNIYEGIVSQLNFKKYATDKEKAESINYDLLETLYASFILTLLSDTYFKKNPDKTCSSELHSDVMKILIDFVATNNGNGYTVGDLHLCDQNKVFKKTRDHLAHDDFVVINQEICFKESGAEGRITVHDFVAFVTSFEESAEPTTLTQMRTHALYPIDPTWPVGMVMSNQDFKFLSNYMYQLKLEDAPIFPRQRDKEYEDKVKDLMNAMVCCFKMGKRDNDFGNVQEIYSKMGILVKQSLVNVKSLPGYETVRQKYINDPQYRKMTLENQLKGIGVLFNMEDKPIENKFNVRKGLEMAVIILKTLKEHPEYDMEQVILALKNIETTFIPHFDDMLLSIYLSNFKAIYEYGLESHFYLQNKTNFISICNGQALDFSKLNLDKMKSPIMKIEKEIGNVFEEIDKYDKETLAALIKTVKSAENAMNGCLGSAKSTVEQKLKKLNEYNSKLNEVVAHQERVKELKVLALDFDVDRYNENLNIIFHIRNAIAHGNVFLDKRSTIF